MIETRVESSIIIDWTQNVKFSSKTDSRSMTLFRIKIFLIRKTTESDQAKLENLFPKSIDYSFSPSQQVAESVRPQIEYFSPLTFIPRTHT